MNTAVILAARKERDSEIPYPLKEFADGECLLGRMLSILRENSYSRILIVVGYRRELFERYRSEDVELVYNPEYEFTSSMASLAKCSRMLEDDFFADRRRHILRKKDNRTDITHRERQLYGSDSGKRIRR